MLTRTALARLAGLWFCCSLFCPRALAEPEGASRVLGPSQTRSAADLLPANSPEYQHLMSLGLEEFEAGGWAEARALFLRGHALAPNARSFRALGMTAFNLKYYPDALRELSRALEDARRPLTGAQRAQTRELVDRVETFVGRYRVQLEPAHAALRVDGLASKLEPDGSLWLSVGAHVLAVEAPGYALATRPLVVDGTDGEALRFQLSRLSAPSPEMGLLGPRVTNPSAYARASERPPRGLWARVFSDYRVTWLAGASTLALVGAATGLRFAALSEAEDVEARCEDKEGCDPWDGETDRRDRLAAASTGLFVGAMVLGVSTVVIALVEHRRVAKRASHVDARPRTASVDVR